jgi:hypothetical protein
LNEEQREELFKTINENSQILGWITQVLSPNYISNEMLRRWVDFNKASRSRGSQMLYVLNVTVLCPACEQSKAFLS